MSKVMSYETGATLTGTASEGLMQASRKAGDTGAVAAYRDADGVWHHIDESRAADYRRMGETVETVCVA